MTQDNKRLHDLNDDDEITSSSSSNNLASNKVGENDLGNTTFTEEEIKQANKPQPNVIVSEALGDVDSTTSYRDKERVDIRANQAPDSTDTNTGGIVSGAAKGASQS